MLRACLCAAPVLATTAPMAHVVIDAPAAQAGATLKVSLRIGHGCGPSPTREVSVEIPAGVRGARPMPKPGWTLVIERSPLAVPYVLHGRRVTDDVSRITWTARSASDMLEGDHADDFSLVVTLPEAAARLYWPVQQVCPQGRLDWIQKPGDASLAAPSSPAPVLEVRPSPTPAVSSAGPALPVRLPASAGPGATTDHTHPAH